MLQKGFCPDRRSQIYIVRDFFIRFFFDGYQNHLANLFDVVLRIIKTETSVDCIVYEVAAAYHEGFA